MARKTSGPAACAALALALALKASAADAVPQRWGVVIGIGSYQSTKIPPLRFAARDADAIYDFLVSPSGGGIPRENAVKLIDAAATRKEIITALGQFLRKAGGDDAVVIFFSGHGSNEPDPTDDAKDGLAKYLVPHDGDPDNLLATAIPMTEVVEMTDKRIKARTVVMLLDSCYSGGAVAGAGALGRGFDRVGGKGASIVPNFYEALLKGEGRVLLTACRPRQIAYELSDLEHGAFTFFVLDGLKGKADRDRDGSVTVDEIFRYVSEKVPPKVREIGGEQEPVQAGTQGQPVVLSRMSAATAGMGKVLSVSGLQITVDLGTDQGLAVQDHLEVVRQSQAIARAVALVVLPDRAVAILIDRAQVEAGDLVRRMGTSAPASTAVAPPEPATPRAQRSVSEQDARARDQKVVLGDRAYDEGNFSEALRDYSDARDLDPDNAALWRKVALCRVKLDEVPLAIKALEKARELAPIDVVIQNTLALVLLRAGQASRALEVAQEAVNARPDEAKLWDTLGQVKAALSQRDEARAAYRKALDLEPGRTGTPDRLHALDE